MMQRKKCNAIRILLCLILLVSGSTKKALCQEIPDIRYEDAMEKLSERSSEDITPEEIYDDSRMESVVNLNNVSAAELVRSGILTKNQADNLLAYIRDYGEILSFNELRGIEGMDTLTIRRIESSFRLGSLPSGPSITPGNLLHYGRHDLIIRYEQVMQEKEGFSRGTYPGSPQKYYIRYAYRFSDRIAIGFGCEKDAGEQFFRGAQSHGFDFYTGYIALQKLGFIRTLVAGNFSASFGQGLCLGSGTSMSTFTGTGVPFRITQGIRPSGSMNEGQYLKGIGATLKLWKLDISLLFSSHKRDATIEPTPGSDNQQGEISSLQYTGYHRTPGEIKGKNAVKEMLWGGNVAYTGKFYRVGLTCISSSWSLPFSGNAAPYKYYTFTGKSNRNLSLDIVVRLKFLTLFGEGAISSSGGKGVIAGIYGDVAQGTTFSLTYRNYAPGYQAQFANPISQNSQAANEQGFLFNICTPLAGKLSLAAYADVYRFPWLKYRVNAPSSGLETAVTLTWQVSPAVVQSGRYSYRLGMMNTTGEPAVICPVEDVSSWAARYRIEWNVSPQLRIRTFFDLKHAGKGSGVSGCGYLVGEDFHFTLDKPHLAVGLRYALFDIPSYDLRIYCYEPDVALAWSAPAYEGEGIRVAASVLIRPIRCCDLEGRFSMTWYSDRKLIGTGNEMINGNTSSDIKLQLRFRL
jgi:hypothetical protein